MLKLLRSIPLRASLVPMRGCKNFCSICAENAFRKVVAHPFAMLRKNIDAMPFTLEHIALYNAGDGVRYRSAGRDHEYDITDIAQLLIGRGAGRIIVSTPGIAPNAINRAILPKLITLPGISPMLSFNRDHLRNEHRRNAFFSTLDYFLKAPHCEIRLVYVNREERSALMQLFRRYIDKALANPLYAKYRRFELTTVPAIPLGRARRLYFPEFGRLADIERQSIQSRIMEQFRAEPDLASLEAITDGDYDFFLRHAAIQFNGMFVPLLNPTPEGLRLDLKIVDLDKIGASKGVLFGTVYRYDPAVAVFIRADGKDHNRVLDLAIVKINDLTEGRFAAYLEHTGYRGDNDRALRVFAVYKNLSWLHEKCLLNGETLMIIMNPDYVDLYVDTITIVMKKNRVQQGDLKPAEIRRAAAPIFAFIRAIAVNG